MSVAFFVHWEWFFEKSVKTAVLKGGRPLKVPKQLCLNRFNYCGVRQLNRPPVYPGGRRGNNSRPPAKIATGSAWQGVAPFARHSLRGGGRGNFCVGVRIVATATARLGTQGVGSTSEHHSMLCGSDAGSSWQIPPCKQCLAVDRQRGDKDQD